MNHKTVKKQVSTAAGQKNGSTRNNMSKVTPNKKVYVVMTFESGRFLYDLMTFLSDYVELYRDTQKDGNMKETAKDLTVARNTLDRLIKKHKPLSWECFQDILSGLLKSDCPYPKNQQIFICEQNPITYEVRADCISCRYYLFYRNCENGVDSLRSCDRSENMTATLNDKLT